MLPDKIKIQMTIPVVDWIEFSFAIPARRDIDSEWKQSKWEDDQAGVLVAAGGNHPSG